MARKFEVRPEKFAWNLDICEETVFIAAYLEVAKFIPPDATWPDELECKFYERGLGVGFHLINSLNTVRRRKGFSPVVFRETDLSDYGKTPDKPMKAEHRCKVRDDLITMNDQTRRSVVEAAKAEMASLPPPHKTYDEWVEWRDGELEERQWSRREVARRHACLRQAGEAAVRLKSGQATAHALAPSDRDAEAENSCDNELPAPTVIDSRIEKIVRMLKLADDPALRNDIIRVLAPDEALNLAEQMEQPELRNALVRHSLVSLGDAL